MTQEIQSPPLEGITVLDVSHVLAGPFCTKILAQLGARVIKVEMPGAGDDSRAFGPFANGKSLYFSAINYDKESIALNLKQPADREIFEGLLGIADVAGRELPARNHGKARLRLGDLARQIPEADLRGGLGVRRHRALLQAGRL